MKTCMKTALLAVALTTGLAAAAQARDLRIAPGAPPAHPANSHLYQGLAKYLPEESGGKLTGVILGPEVVGLRQMKDALQTELADVGNLLPLYFPAELPSFALAGELSLSGTDPHAMGAALTEYTVTCVSCQAEQTKFGVVYLGSGSSDPYVLLTTKPVASMADVKGLRLRSGGAPFSRWAENFGAVPVSIGVGETFESMSQGTIDGSIASVGDLLSFRLVELVKQITVVPLGSYFSTSNFAVAKNTWSELGADDRKALVRAANRANADFTQRWGYDFPVIANKAAAEAGIKTVKAEAAFVDASKAFAAADQGTAAKISAERFAMSDAPKRIADFMALVAKWEKITAELNHDSKKVADRVWTDVWSKVDLAKYGN